MRFGPREVAAEIDRAGTLLAEVAGTAPVGFRSPGYNLSPTVIAELIARGYRYDSSILPAPLYYAAKAAVMGSMRLTGRASRSTLGDPRFLFAPTTPYRPDARAPWRRGNAPIVELPITVTPGLRLWIIGTSLLIAPPMLRDRLVATAAKARFFNLEMHGIDLIGAEEDGIPAELVRRQPDLRVPLATKLRAFESVLDQLARFSFLRLRDAAETVVAAYG